MDHHYQEWSTNAPRGLLLIGAGLSIIGTAIIRKGAKRGGWVAIGTIGLVVFNAGIAIFGEAVKHRTLYEAKLDR